MDKIRVKGVCLGLIVASFLDFAFGFALGFVEAYTARPRPTTQQQLEALVARMLLDDNVLIMILVVGTFTTVFGGYLAGRFAPDAPVLNALCCGLLGCAACFVFYDPKLPPWFNITGIASILPATLLGGYLADGRDAEESGGLETFV
ncbi:MAG: hypothetical protein QM811_15500 [Pirellulales bacterium]